MFKSIIAFIATIVGVSLLSAAIRYYFASAEDLSFLQYYIRALVSTTSLLIVILLLAAYRNASKEKE